MYLDRFRQSTGSAAIAQWLVALFLFQAMLPVQAHSRLQTDDHGITVVVCTLQGEVNVTLDLDGDHDHPASAAMQFSDLVSDTTPLVALLPPPTFVMARSTVVESPSPAPGALRLVEASSRAPPRV